MAALVPNSYGDAIAYFRIGVTLPTYLCGAVLNCYLVAKYMKHKEILVQQPIDRIVRALNVIGMVWSLFSCLRILGAFLFQIGTQQQSPTTGILFVLVALDIPTVITVLLGTHSLLAFERYSLMRGDDAPSDSSFSRFVIFQIGLTVTVVITCCVSFLTSSNTIGTWPVANPARAVWSIIISLGFLWNFSVIVYCYASTYFYMREKLKEVMKNFRVDQVRIMMQREVFFNCLIMSGAVFISYVPQIAFAVLLAVGTISSDPNNPVSAWFNVIQLQCIALDSVVSPLLIMLFMKPQKRVENAVQGEDYAL